MSLNLRSDANFESHLGVQSFELAASNDIESARQNQRFSETKRGTFLEPFIAESTAPDFAPTGCIRGLLAPTGRSEGHYWK
jgi:hypothetical protein